MSIWSKIGDALGNIAPVFPLVGAAADYMSNANTNKANMKLAQYQNEYNLAMWNKQNEYNSPQAQMQRLADAGLNPNMVYGGGSAANQAQQIQKAEAPRLQAYTGFSNSASNIINSTLTSAQIKNLEEQNTILKTDALAKKLEILRNGLRFSGEVRDFDFERNIKRYASRLSDLAVVQAEQDYERGWVDYDTKVAERNIASIRESITQKQLEEITARVRTEIANADIREHEKRDYEELGIRPSDPLWSRAIANVLIDVVGKDKASYLIKKILGL